ncbi:MAG: hypothetical protein JW994_05815 [Candidatus Omnitrophica bacterium]|nr:hypothetical protein [Candidatus Omnitrophota bacterium]
MRKDEMKALGSSKVKIFLTVLLVYLFYIAPDYVTAGTNRYIALTKSIVDDKTFDIDRYFTTTRDYAPYKEHYYIGAAPGLSLMAAPIYIALKPLLALLPEAAYLDLEPALLNLFFAFFLSVLPGALIAVLLYDVLLSFPLKEKERILIVFASSFGTSLFFYSTRFLAHVTATFLLLSAFCIFFKSKMGYERKYLFFLSGICIGLAVLTEYVAVIGSLLLLIYAFCGFKKYKILNYTLLALGMFPTILFYLYYHYRCFDNPFTTATKYSIMIGPVPFSLPQPRFIYELTFGTYRGLFMYMPIMLIAVLGILLFFLKPKKEYLQEMAFISLFSSATFLVICMFCNWVWPWGGDFGPRYFICIIPFLMIPIVFAYGKIRFKIIFWIAALSVFINWCGVQYGDSDNVFTNMGVFIFRGLNSNLSEWAYKLTNLYIRRLNVITHFSPFVPLVALSVIICIIWKGEIYKLTSTFLNESSISRKNVG